MGFWGPVERNIQLNRLNNFSLNINQQVYYLTRKTRFMKFVCFFRKRKHTAETSRRCILGNQSAIFWADSFP